jgi:hypothetical protein
VIGNTLQGTVLVAVIGFLATAPASAWATDPVLKLPAADQTVLAEQLGTDVLGDALPSKPIDDPGRLFSFARTPVTYLFTSGRNKGKIQTLVAAKVERPRGELVWKLPLAPSLIGFLKQLPDGDIEMPAVEDTGAEALVVSTPPNPFLSKGMKPGETRRFVQQVSVRYLDDIGAEQWSGKLQNDFTYLGTYRVKVPAGTYDAVLLRSKVDGKVGPARTQAVSYSLFSPGQGLVAMILQQNVTAFWIYNVNGAGGKVLVPTPKPGG